jgi:lipid II:glycine glycyltransferase (peptidoglycan interpeptide bridge formation enzyme)
VVKVAPIPLNRVHTRNNLMQSRLWGLAKRRAGTEPRAFKIDGDNTILTILSHLNDRDTYASIPWGPESSPSYQHGRYLEELAEALRPYMPRECVYLRFDLPWRSPWDDRPYSKPSVATQELEINFGTEYHRLRKAPTDVQPVDTLIVDIDQPDEAILDRMKPKTRYNIRLAQRHGVRVVPVSPRRLDEWYAMYRETMRRHGKSVHGYHHFARIFEAADQTVAATIRPGAPRRRHNLRLLMAERNGRPVAGMVLAVSGSYAIYLYGASGATDRRAMPSYLLQWKAIQTARRLGATKYDLFGIPPDSREGHPMHGLLRFKSGFGGDHVTRRGCWDYPFQPERYNVFAGREAADRGYHG